MGDSHISTSLLGPLCAFLSSCTWAFGSAAFGKVAQKVPSPAINATRAILAFSFFSLTLFFMPQRAEAIATFSFQSLSWCFVSILSSYAIGDFLFFVCALDIGIPAALAVASIFPIWSAIIGIFRGQYLSKLASLGLILAVVGTAFVILSQEKNSQFHSQFKPNARRGFILAFITSFFWALNAVSVSAASQTTHPVVISLIRMLLALILCPVIGFVTAPITKIPFKRVFMTWSELKPYLPAFLLESVGGSFFYAYSMGHTPLALGVVLTSLAPVISVPVAVALKIEKFSFKRSIAIMIVVCGIILMSI